MSNEVKYYENRSAFSNYLEKMIGIGTSIGLEKQDIANDIADIIYDNNLADEVISALEEK